MGLQVLMRTHQDIVLQWVPSHCGLVGNERADHLAKEGSHMEQTNPGTTYQEIKTLLKRERENDWKARHPDADTRDSWNGLDREGQVMIFRMRTGHCLLKAHLFKKFKIGDSSKCPCGKENMAPSHVLQDCANYRDTREQFWPAPTPVQQKLYG